MNILLVTQVFPPKTGGSGRWLWELYRRLGTMNVHVIAGDAPGSAEFDRRASIPIDRIALEFPNWGLWPGVPHYLRASRAIRRTIARVRPDAIHCGKCLPEGLLAAIQKMLTGIPFLVYAHGEELTLAASSSELRLLTRRVLKASDHVLANSQHTKGLLTREWGVDDAKVSVVNPGVDTSTFVPSPPVESTRTRLGWAGRRVVLTVGALQKRKGQDMMIRALPMIRNRCPDVLYSMIGEGWERPYLEELVSRHGVGDVVQFRGTPADAELIDCYQQCDLFALPNRRVGWDFEGFGIALIEAQACGRPVIAGNSGGAPEAVVPGASGEIVSCDEPDALAAATVSLLNAPERRASMGQCGRRWAVEHFDWEVLTRRAIDLFGSLAKLIPVEPLQTPVPR
jgi:phosphatidylinositol alpha-1,6-mannosyltransferase